MLTRKFLKEFADPSCEWRFAPFWFLNHRLEDEELIRQINEMHEAGFGGFILHARHGLLTPYMSDEWLDRIETCCAEAKKLGMWAWLYDENNWPSGTCDARVIAEHPEYRMSQLYIADRHACTGPDKLTLEVPTDDEIVFALLVPTDESGQFRCDSQTRIRDLAGKVKDGVLKARIPAGTWTVLVLARTFCEGTFFSGYTDLMDRRACKLFIRYTHDVYAKRLKRYYGRTVKGIFTDEPSAWRSERPDSVHWTPRLPREFARDHRYPLATALAALFFDVGPETVKFRCDFARTVLRLYIDAFYGPIYDHCERRGILSMGHMNAEGEWRAHAKQQLDFFAVTDRMHYAGLDALTMSVWPSEDRHQNLVAAKFASSSGHLLGKPRVMNESWGLASGWKLDLEDLKLLGDWLVALGTNYFMPHAVYYSLEGVRKWECPPDEFYHEPYWPYYKRFADYLARLSMVFTGGQHVAPVAVLYPNRTGWVTQSGLEETDPDADAHGEKVQATLLKLSEELLRARLDFDYLSEELLQKAELAGGHVVVPDRKGQPIEEFQVLVLPEVTVLDRDTVRAIDDFVTGGGRLYLVGAKPAAYSETGTDPELAEWLAKLMQEYPERVRFTDEVTDELIAHISDSVFRHVHIPTPPTGRENNRDIVVLHHRRQEGSFFFLLNTSRSHTFIDVPVAFATTGTPRLFDALTGKVHPLEHFEHEEGRTLVRMDFAPQQSHLILLADGDDATPLETEPADEKLRLIKPERELLELTGPWEFSAEKGNFLPLTHFTCEPGNTAGSMNWCRATLTYETGFEVKTRPEWCRLIVDGLMRQECFNGRGIVPVTIKLNSTELTGFSPSDHYDRLCFETDVTGLLREGRNEIEISNTTGGMGPNAHLTQPLVLVGDFAVTDTPEGPVLDAPRRELDGGDWTAQGYPCFSGIGILKRTIEVPEFTGRVFIRFAGLAEMVEVVLNGTPVGTILWPPYELELTGHLVPGANELELRVANTNHNLFAGSTSSPSRPEPVEGTVQPRPSGLTTKAVIVEGTRS